MSTTDVHEPSEETRTSRRKQRTHHQLLDAALEVLSEHGYEESTMTQIAERADVARKTLFNHFATKEDLVSEVIGLRWAAQLEQFESEIGDDDDGYTAVMGFFDSYAAVSESARDFYTGTVVRLPHRFTVEHHARIAEHVRNCLKRDVPVLSDETRDYAEILVDSFMMTHTRWAFGPYVPGGLRAAVRRKADLLLRNAIKATAPLH